MRTTSWWQAECPEAKLAAERLATWAAKGWVPRWWRLWDLKQSLLTAVGLWEGEKIDAAEYAAVTGWMEAAATLVAKGRPRKVPLA